MSLTVKPEFGGKPQNRRFSDQVSPDHGASGKRDAGEGCISPAQDEKGSQDSASEYQIRYKGYYTRQEYQNCDFQKNRSHKRYRFLCVLFGRTVNDSADGI